MVLKFFETLDSAANYIEKEENENGLKYVRRSVEKSFGSDSKLSHSVVMRLLRMLMFINRKLIKVLFWQII